MSLFLHILTNEHENEHDLPNKPLYSEPKIYNANGDLSKRWYVYYSYRDPETGKMVRQPNIYEGVNRYRTKTERLEILTKLSKAMRILLKAGYSPYEEKKISKERFQALMKVKTNKGNTVQDLVNILSVKESNNSDSPEITINKSKQEKNSDLKENFQAPKLTQESFVRVDEALERALKVRKGSWSKTTAPTMIGHYNNFIVWLKKENLHKIDIRELKKLHISEFLQQIMVRKGKNTPLTNASNKTKNNYRLTLSSLFSQLSDDEYIKSNFIKEVRILKENPKKNKSYSDKQVKDIREHLEKNDPYLRVFIQFMSYAFLRNKEVCNIQIKNIDLDSKRIYVPTKTGAFDVIPIISELEKIIKKMNIDIYEPNDYLITKYGHPSKWESNEKTRTGYFSKRFNKNIRIPLNLDSEYTLYSFRHTAALNLYHSIKNEGHSHQEILLKLMPITRHKSKEGLENYLRDIGAFIPKDYGEKYTIEF